MSGKALATDDKGRERRLNKPGELLADTFSFRLKGDKRPYVSRAGGKLESALDSLRIDVGGLVALDVGLSTGGFTDCLFQRGIEKVHGVDVSYGIVHWRIRQDERLILHERTNARTLSPELLGERVDLVVIDVSFISLKLILDPVFSCCKEGGQVLAMVKPQFELPKELVPGGVVSDPQHQQQAVDRVRESAQKTGFKVLAEAPSAVAGTQGNREFFLHLSRE